MSSRLLADDPERDRHVVVKLGPSASVEREARVLAGLDHPAIVRLRDAGADGERGWIATDHVEGVDLETWLRAGRPDPKAVRSILVQLADALLALHGAGWLHRDLKPANVVRRPDGTVVLIDLGAAGPPGEAQEALSSLTEGYAAPEQYEHEGDEGAWTDVYGLAALGWRMLTGSPPMPARARQRRGMAELSLESLAPCPPDLAAALLEGLSLDPARRPQDALAFRGRLAAEPNGPPPVEEPAATAPAGGELLGVSPPGPAETLDEGPPTVLIERSSPKASIPEEAAELAAPTAASSGQQNRRWVPILLTILAVLTIQAVTALGVGWRYLNAQLKDEWIVDPEGSGDTRTIAEALAKARDGAIVLVRPGVYEESLVIDTNLVLRAVDAADPPRIVPPEGPCLVVLAPAAAVSGLGFERTTAPEAGEAEPCVLVTGRSVRLEGLEVKVAFGPALRIDRGAEPAVIGARFSAGSGPAILFTGGAGGLIELAEAQVEEGAAIIVRGGASPEITGATLQGGGVVWAEGAAGALRESRIGDAGGNGIEIGSGARPEVTGNTIERAREAGLFAYDAAGGTFQGNTITDAGLAGVVVTSEAAPDIIGNTVRGSGEQGIIVVQHGQGRIEGNVIQGSEGAGIAIAAGSTVELGQNRLENNGAPDVVDSRTP